MPTVCERGFPKLEAEDFGRTIRTETERWAPLVRRLGITAD
ncbi:MAG: hypothetical protein ACK5PW_08110 [Burkholderiales bacterium]